MQPRCVASRRRHLFSVCLLTLLVPLSFLLLVRGSAEASHDGAASGIGSAFELPSASAVLNLLAESSAARPTLLLFIDDSEQDKATMTDPIQAKVRQLATDIPPSVLRVHAFSVPVAVTERKLVDLLLNGVATQLPALVLFHSRVSKAQVVPGSLISAVPLSPPLPYPHADQLHRASYMELRTWVLSELPARYADPVTFHLIPSLQFIFNPAETQATLRLVQQAAAAAAGEGAAASAAQSGVAGGRAALPAVVSMAYVRLTTHGSEDVVAALSSLATQAGNAVLTLVTESREVAAAWGLTQEHTMATAPWAAVEAAYLTNTNGDDRATTAAVDEVVLMDGVSPAQAIGTVEEVAEATAGSPDWQHAVESTRAVEASELRAWSRAMEAFNTTSPLRKIDSAAHFVHELVSLQQAIKIIFVLRESDEMWFHHHLDIAVQLASRMRQTSVLYNTTTLNSDGGRKGGSAKMPSRVLRSWSPPMRVEVFWTDAEQLPEVADGLLVAQVPSVLILVPLQSRFQQMSEGEGEAEARASEAGLRSPDPFLGVHTVNRYDLFTAAYVNDAGIAVDPPTGKEAQPLFPASSDALIRFLASDSFLGALQSTIRPVRLSQLRTSLSADAARTRGRAASPSSASSLPNRRYAQLDHRYYPLRLAEELMEGPAYVRQILNGSSPLPVLTEAERRAAEGATRRKSDAPASAKDTKAAAAAAKKKASWEAELTKRRREREARIQRKAAEDAATREKEKVVFQKSIEAAFREEEKAAAAGSEAGLRSSGGGATQVEGGLLVRRPSSEAALEKLAAPEMSADGSVDVTTEREDAEDAAQRVRRRRRYKEYKEWQADRTRMVDNSVRWSGERALSLRFKWD